MKRAVALFLVVLCACASFGQSQSKEMKAVDFLVGRWTGNHKVSGFGPKPQTVRGNLAFTRQLNGTFLHGTFRSVVNKEPMEGLQMLTYDAEQKTYRAWWFDNGGPQAMELTGSLNGNVLTLVSKPMNYQGQEMVFRSIWTKKSARSVSNLVQMQQGGKWVTVIEGTYTRS